MFNKSEDQSIQYYVYFTVLNGPIIGSNKYLQEVTYLW